MYCTYCAWSFHVQPGRFGAIRISSLYSHQHVKGSIISACISSNIHGKRVRFHAITECGKAAANTDTVSGFGKSRVSVRLWKVISHQTTILPVHSTLTSVHISITTYYDKIYR
ncbi:hypothetical protein I7I53_06904 [Histoplasma capsulatum var. duboisii H88]|uniref:Uncharacterized protein n=1 Tax=Ajellomyces capsulatus (strain H88) TaxID=544711 RepID=A0A8A1LD83_AJEC8|nr:hypothetical protein I7I53_06904 [Histoplasma capsulatum var. duboisii H88]